jgi:hypothetical protein
MQTIFTLAILPLFCLLGFIILLVVIIYLVFRNLHSKNISTIFSSPEINANGQKEIPMADGDAISKMNRTITTKNCPACGAENGANANKCDYCGAKLF